MNTDQPKPATCAYDTCTRHVITGRQYCYRHWKTLESAKQDFAKHIAAEREKTLVDALKHIRDVYPLDEAICQIAKAAPAKVK